MSTFYRTLIAGDLVQESALTTGGNRPHGLVDLPLARDGAGRPVLPGSTLAGVFIHTARRFLGRDVPAEISSGEGNIVPSRWRFEHGHPQNQKVEPVFCQHVTIDHRTGAAADDHLFNLEAVPRGHRWNFFMEIVPQPGDEEDEIRRLEALTLPVLREWSRLGGCRLGRGSRHGYGWLHLENLRVFRLSTTQATRWPNNAEIDYRDAGKLAEYFKQHGIQELDLAAFAAHCAPALDELDARPATVIELAGTLEAGVRKDDFGADYGLDSLSIGGHARLLTQAGRWYEDEKHLNRPQDIELKEKDFNPAFFITAHERPDGGLEPYIPGASIRGVWRAALSRALRARGIAVRNPGGPDKFLKNDERSPVDWLFGDTTQAGVLSLADAYPTDDDWLLAWQQHVAIDELTGGAYESSKFDRLALLGARFAWRARIDMDNLVEANDLAQDIEKLIDILGRAGHLPLGGGQWRGHSHVSWQMNPRSTRLLGDSGDPA
jgi:CRISPR/Cas system CSM-associated protein Csm3 (group 7 of RAMP superfamily)